MNDQILFTFADMKRLFLRSLRKIKSVFVLSALFVFFILLLKPPHYPIESTFKQSSKQNDISSNMKKVVQQFMPLPSESGVIAVMQSTEVIGRAVEKLGMQVACTSDFFIAKVFKRIWSNLVLELGGTLSDSNTFSFADVFYSGEKPLRLFIKVKEGKTYQLFDAQKQFLGEGALGESVPFSLGQLTLRAAVKDVKTDSFYSLSVNPLMSTIKGLRSKLRISPHKLDKNILQLHFSSKDRNVGAQFLNHLMLSYQDYLKQENDDICQMQLQYLNKRQQELTSYYDEALYDHAAYLKENLEKNGFIGFTEEITTLSEPKNFYTSKLFDVDLELKRLNDARQSLVPANSLMQPSNEELLQVETQLREANHLLVSVKKQKKIPQTPSLLKEPRSAIAMLVKQIAAADQPQVGIAQEDRHHFVTYLQEIIGQFEQKHKTLAEDLKLQQEGFDEFLGLNLATAQGLLVEYTRQRDSFQAQMKELIFLREQLNKPGFEVSSLGGVIDDGVIRDVVNKASSIALQLQDEDNRSAREQERLIDVLQTQKNFLSHYLVQSVDLKRLRLKLLGDKIAFLQQATLLLLEAEKELLKNKLHELNGRMGELPDKWRRESLLAMKKELGAAMLEGVSHIIETKFLGQHTFQIGSKPLDKAVAPLKPKKPNILLYTLISALFGAVLYYFFIFCRALLKGLPLSDETMRLLGLPVSGKLSKYCATSLAQVQESDLETLRHIVELLSHNRGKGLIAACIGGHHPDYSSSLAELLSMRGLRTVVIQCVFDKPVQQNDLPGLWQYLQEQTFDLPVKQKGSYDLITSGGTSRHSAEILCGPKFKTLLSDLKERYDVVLLYSSADPAKIEGHTLLNSADVALITVQQETKEDLQVYQEWTRRKANARTTFIYAEEFF